MRSNRPAQAERRSSVRRRRAFRGARGDHRAAAALALAAATTLAACSAPDAGSGGDATGLPQLELVGTFGCADCGGAEQLSTRSLSLAEDGRVYLVDAYAPFVRQLDASAQLVGAFGAQGQGPGEMQAPMRSWPDPDGSVWVYELVPAGMLHFDAQGSFLGRELVQPMIPTAGDWDRSARRLYMVAFIPPDVPGTRGDTRSLIAWEPGMTELETVMTADQLPRKLDDPSASSPDTAAAVGPDGGLVIGDAWRYRVRALDPHGALRFEAQRDLELPVKEPDRLRREQEMYRQAGLDPADVSEQEPHFHRNGLSFDDQGRLWVLTNRRSADGTAIDVFSPEGAYLGELMVPATIIPSEGAVFDVAGGRLAVVHRDEVETPFVRLFQISG